MSQPVLVAGARTPIGRLLGSLSSQSAPQLGGLAIRAALERAGLDGAQDAHAAESYARAASAIKEGRLAEKITPVATVRGRVAGQ